MIDIKTGHLTISPGLELKPGARLADVKKWTVVKSTEIEDMKNGYVWLTWRNVKIASDFFIFSLCFHSKALESVEVIVNKEVFKAGSWDDWSESVEKKRLSMLRKWLKKEIGGTRGKFIWGEISTTFDERGGSSSIVITYS